MKGLLQKAVMDDFPPPALLLLSFVAEVSMLLHQRPCCPLSNLLHRRHAISGDRAHLEQHASFLEGYLRLPNGHPGLFLMGVCYLNLMGTPGILEKDVLGFSHRPTFIAIQKDPQRMT